MKPTPKTGKNLANSKSALSGYHCYLKAQGTRRRGLDGIRFCVFGMGDCEAARKIEDRMEQLGATRILEMGTTQVEPRAAALSTRCARPSEKNDSPAAASKMPIW